MERVGIYNRCSTEEEAQINALEIQAQESREIAASKGWQITAQYIEAETGTSTKKRIEYQRMMEDMERNCFDIIMIKSIDRLMRSTKDWYLFIDKVVSFQKKLFIYMDNKFYEPEDALITGIKAILAEDFSRELSKKIKHAHKRRQDNRLGINFTRPIFGWDKIEKDKYVLNEEEADYYRLAFCMAYEGHGFYTIAKYMYEQGVRSKATGKRISEVQWRKMLYSPRAHGTVILHQREYDFYTKRFIKIPPEQWIYMENALPAIVSKEYQDKVIAVIKDRAGKSSVKNYSKDVSFKACHILSGKLYCGCCGSMYDRVVIHKGEKGQLNEWKCKARIRQGKDACPNKNVIEESVFEAIETACIQFLEKENFQQKNRDTYLIEKVIKIVQKVLEDNPTQKERKKLEKELQEQEKKKLVLLDKLAGEVIDDGDFQMLNLTLSQKIKELQYKIERIEESTGNTEEIEERLQRIRHALQEGEVIKKAKIKTWIQKIEKITVCPEHQLEVQTIHYNIVIPYIHKNNTYRKKEQIKQEILEIFKENPHMQLKDIIPRFDVKASYINECIRELKQEEKLVYQRHGNHTGEWIVSPVLSAPISEVIGAGLK